MDAKRLGIQDDLQQKRDSALDQLAVAVAIGGVVAAQARDALEKLYITKSDSLDGLDKFIQERKARLQ